MIILYGTKIKADIELPLNFSHQTEVRYEVELFSEIPEELQKSITCGFYLYFAHGRDVFLYSNREFDGSEIGQPWCYEVKDIVTFYWISGERTIYYEMAERGNLNLLSFWFVHLLLPFYMTLEEMYDFFHAGSVEVNDKAIFFIAPSMGGKSTMTDYFIRQGHTLLSDDKVATFISGGKFMAVGSHPHHRPYRKFEDLGYQVENFTKNFQPIHVFYELQRVDSDVEISIDEVKGFDKFDALLPNYLYMFSWLKPKRLQYLSLMLNDIKVFYVKIPWDMNRLNEVYNAICKHSKGI